MQMGAQLRWTGEGEDCSYRLVLTSRDTQDFRLARQDVFSLEVYYSGRECSDTVATLYAPPRLYTIPFNSQLFGHDIKHRIAPANFIAHRNSALKRQAERDEHRRQSHRPAAV